MIRKSKKLKIGIGIAIVFSIVGTVGALNGWFGKSGVGFSSSLLPEWKYRRPITLSGNTENLTDYQVKIELPASLTSQLVSDGKLQSDFDDIRFTDADDNQLLSFWIETATTTTTSTIWAKVPSLSANNNSVIYIYYGNLSASSASDGDATFEFFDDFEGTSLDTSKWISVNSPTITVSNSILEIYFDSGVGQYIYGTTGVGYNHQLEARAKYNAITTQSAMELSSSPDVPDPWKNSIGIWTEWGDYDHNLLTATDGTVIQNTNFPTTVAGEYKRYKIRREGPGVASVWKDDESITADNANLITGTAYPDIFGNSAAGGPHSHWVDWIFIRKYISPEPTAAIGSEQSQTTPVAHWRFDEGSGTTTYDSTPNNNDGTLGDGTCSPGSGACPSWTTGKHGSALKFDGVDDYVDYGNDESLDITDAITVEAWVYVNGEQNIYASPVDKYVGGDTGSGYHLTTYGSKIGFTIRDQNSTYRATDVTNEWYNQWVFLVGTYNGSVQRLFINGEEKKNLSWIGTIKSNDLSVRVGGRGTSNTSFNGLIDDVRIYNYARTADEIRLDYNAGLAAHFGPGTSCDEDPGACMTKGLVGYWSFDESAGQTAYDASDEGNNGAIHGAKWAKGKEGSALSFDGVDDYVEVPDDESLDITDEITVMAWIYTRDIPEEGHAGIISKGPWYGQPYELTVNWGSWLSFITKNESGNTENLAIGFTSYLNKWTLVTGVYSSESEEMKLYVNGVLKATKEQTGKLLVNTKPVYIGREGKYFNGTIDEVRIYNRALSAEEIRYHYNHTLPEGAASPTAMKEDSSLVGYWSFNEGSGQIAYDKSGNGNNGTIHGAAWAAGKSGSALQFDGVDDYVDCGSDESLDITDAITIEVWVYRESDDTRQPIIFNGYNWANKTGIRLAYREDSHRWEILMGDGTGMASETSAKYIDKEQWVHLVVSWDGNGDKLVRMFINAELEPGSPSFSGPISYPSSYPFLVSSYFNGTIDEVRIYNRALTEKEIQEHYRESKYYLASKFGPGTDCDTDPGSCMDYGLVGYWSFDEGAGQTAYDASDNGNNGTLTNSPKWTKGKYGSALSFDGVDDYVEVSDDESLDITDAITIEAWVKPNTLLTDDWETQDIIAKYHHNYGIDERSGYQLNIQNIGSTYYNRFSVYIGKNTTWATVYSNTEFEVDKWYHVVGVNDGTNLTLYINGVLDKSEVKGGSFLNNDYDLWVGRSEQFGRTFNGLIDEVRIYNRALSEEEIRYHYNRGAPVAHWKFDEGEGSTAYDNSINSNNGILHLGASGNTATSSAWVQGKYGSALSFDGVDDYVDCGNDESLNISGEITVEAWVKIDDYNVTQMQVVHKEGAFDMSVRPSSRYVHFDMWQANVGKKWSWTPYNVLPTSGWIYLVGTYKDGDVDIYINTESQTVYDNMEGTIDTSTNNLLIGKRETSSYYYFNGIIDDVRIYNYARTPEQIKQDYNAGLSTHFR